MKQSESALTKQRVMGWRVLPTTTGVAYLLMLIILFCLAVNYSNNLIFTFCFLLIGVLLLSLWLGFRNLLGLKIGEVKALPVHCGQKLQYLIPMREQAGLDHFYIQLRGDSAFQQLSRNQDRLWTCSIPTQRRGIRSSDPLAAETCWPMGLFRISRILLPLPEVLVYPEAVDLQLAPKPAGSEGLSRDECEELTGNRRYQPGDNLRRINWRVLAKNQQLVVKEFDGATGDPSLWLRWEDTGELAYEQRISCLSHHVLACFEQGREFGLQLPAEQIAPARGPAHLHQCLEALALLPEEV